MLERSQLHRVDPSHGRQPTVQKARLSDVNEMHGIINYYAERQQMLPKTQLQLYENVRDYSIVTGPPASNRVLGCGALHIYWEDLAEIRALAVAPGMTNKGVGAALVERLLDEARELKIEQVFLFTYEPRFFARFGFIQVEHRTMPLKVYN